MDGCDYYLNVKDQEILDGGHSVSVHHMPPT